MQKAKLVNLPVQNAFGTMKTGQLMEDSISNTRRA